MGDVRAPVARRLAVLGTAAAAAFALACTSASTAAAEGTILGVGNANAIPGSYLVVFRDGVSAQAQDLTANLAAKHNAQVTYMYSAAVRGFAANMSEQAARR